MEKFEISVGCIMYEPECEHIVAGGKVRVEGEVFDLLFERNRENQSVEMTGEKVLMAYYRDGGALVSVGLDSKYHDAFDEPTFDRAEEFAKEVYKRVVKMVDEAVTAEREVLRSGK